MTNSFVGKRFGKLTVVQFDHSYKRNQWWLCRCDCGNEKVVFRGSLTSGDIISCGCYRQEHKHEFGRKHGMSRSTIYQVWSGMLQRCSNPHAENYNRYGGRGIKVCEEWKNNFESFYTWATTSGYVHGLTIDRIDTNGDYTPNNCRWVDRFTQQNNTRRNRHFIFNGISHTISEWARLLNVNRATLEYRILHGNLADFNQLIMEE